MSERVLWFVVPEGAGDPARVSGGNVYDARTAAGLRRIGWDVRWVEAGSEPTARAAFAAVPTGGTVLVDGLVAIHAHEALAEEASRLRMTVLVHMVTGAFDGADAAAVEGEARAVAAAELIVSTSAWARGELLARGLTDRGRVVVATPGADEAPLAAGTADRGALLCVGVVAPHKGQDLLVEALTALGPGWSCTIAGSATAHPRFARRIAAEAAEAGVADRITWAGVVGDRDLDALYARTDLLVAPSRTESYGMAIADALRRGIPVVATDVGGISEAVAPGRAAMLVPPGRPEALRAALGRWMSDPSLRAALTAEARRAGPLRATWADTAHTIDRALRRLS